MQYSAMIYLTDTEEVEFQEETTVDQAGQGRLS